MGKLEKLNIAPVANHREREKGVIVYPVYSRRSAGLSIGINLFPDKKSCAFDCPYCEVFPFSNSSRFSYEQMEDDLRAAVFSAQEKNIPIRDICFSGNGEPTMSPFFFDAFNLAQNIRTQQAPEAVIVVITNAAGLSQPDVFSFLKKAADAVLDGGNPSLDIWLKLDAGTPGWYQKINRCALPFDNLIEKIKEFSACAAVTIQTMLCAVNGEPPPEEEALAREKLTLALAENASGGIRKVQLYGKARPAPEDPLASPLPREYLEKRAASLRNLFSQNSLSIPVEVYL